MTEQYVSREDPNDGAPRISAEVQKRVLAYLAAFAIAAVLFVGAFYGALGLLNAIERLPPPPVSGTWCIDSRFAWLKHQPRWKQASLIAVGSSTTWRNLDFDVVSREMKQRGVVNAAPCFLTVNQIRYLVEYLLSRDSRPATVLTVLTPRDFDGCSRNRTEFFDPEVASRYLESHGYSWWLYFRNFRLKDVFFHAIYAGERRVQMTYDPFGSGPLVRETPDAGHPVKPESRCYAELTQLARLLDARGVQFIVVTFPVMQKWADRHDPNGATRLRFKFGIASALSQTKTILVDGMSHWHVPDSAFTDPVHLQWGETAAFTRFLWREAREGGADLPPLDQPDDAVSSSHMDGVGRIERTE
jgi:hypothetical protein